MQIEEMSVAEIPAVIPLYIEYYNEHEGGCWTEKTATTRIRQVLTMQGAKAFIAREDGQVVGFVMGYFKQYDDLMSYMLEEIVIASEKQHKGYGSALLEQVKKRVFAAGAACVELISINDDLHHAFYGKMGFKNTTNYAPKVCFATQK